VKPRISLTKEEEEEEEEEEGMVSRWVMRH